MTPQEIADSMSKKEGLTPIEKLDEMLKCLNHGKQEMYSISDVITFIGFKTETNNQSLELHIIIEKLHKDGYAQIYEDRLTLQGIQAGMKYSISFDGQVFIQNGGYAMQEYRKNLALEKQSVDLKVAKQSNIVLAIATGVLALEAVLHILSFLHQHFCH